MYSEKKTSQSIYFVKVLLYNKEVRDVYFKKHKNKLVLFSFFQNFFAIKIFQKRRRKEWREKYVVPVCLE